MVRINLEVSFVRMTSLDDEDVFLFNVHQKNGAMQTHMEEGEGDAAASRERPKTKPNICVGSPRFKQTWSNFYHNCRMAAAAAKKPKSRFTRTLNLPPELNRAANF